MSSRAALLLVGVAALLGLLALGGCGGGAAQATPRDTVVLAFQSPPDSLDPFRFQSARARSLLTEALSLSLLTPDPESGDLGPWLARELPRVAEGRTTWELRADARWADGRPVTADDVRLTFERARDLGAEAGAVRAALVGIAAVEVLDLHRFALVHDGDPADAIESFGRHFIVVPDGAEPAADADWGAGPYRLVAADSSETVLARRRPWWGDAEPAFAGLFKAERWEQRYVRDQTQLLARLGAGDVHVAGLEPDQAAGTLPQGVRVDRYYLPGFSFIGWNLTRAPFDDARVRTALGLLVPRRRLAESTLAGARPVDGPFPDLVDDEVTRFSPSRARELLADAGFADDGTGRLARDGRPLEVTVLTPTGGLAWRDATISALIGAAAQVGVAIRESRLEIGGLLRALREHDFDAFLIMWNVRETRPTFRDIFHSSETGEGGRNFAGWRSAEADALIARLAHAGAERAHREAARDLHRLVVRERPITCLFQHPTFLAWRDDLVSVRVGRWGLVRPAVAPR